MTFAKLKLLAGMALVSALVAASAIFWAVREGRTRGLRLPSTPRNLATSGACLLSEHRRTHPTRSPSAR